MSEHRLSDLAQMLRDAGEDPGSLPALQQEMDQVRDLPLSGWVDRAHGFLMEQWGHLLGEVAESKEAGSLLMRVAGGESLDPIEQDVLRAQLADGLRMLPAGVCVLAAEAIPVPGTGMVSVWALHKMGLMPSRWREAHLLAELRKEAARVRQVAPQVAAELDAMGAELEHEAEEHERVETRCATLMHWDADMDGSWSDGERQAYLQALTRVRRHVSADPHEKRWFLRYQAAVYGPYRLPRIRSAPLDLPLMVCFDGDTGWVELEAALVEARLD